MSLEPLLSRIERAVPAGVGKGHGPGRGGPAEAAGRAADRWLAAHIPATVLSEAQGKKAAVQFGTLGSGVSTPLIEAARLVLDAVGSSSSIETPGGELAPGENESYETGTRLLFPTRPLAEAGRSCRSHEGARTSLS